MTNKIVKNKTSINPQPQGKDKSKLVRIILSTRAMKGYNTKCMR